MELFNPLHALDERSRERPWSELADHDLLAWFLCAGQRPEAAWRLAGEIYGRMRSLTALREADDLRLREFGFNARQARGLLAAREMLRRSARRMLPRGRAFSSSREVFQYFQPLAADLKQECFWALLLDGKNRIQGLRRISVGCLTRTLVHPREVFRPAIREAAAGVLFVHNHPSGDPQPSQEDIEITRRLVETGNVVGIRVLDHVIISGYRYFSFADEGLVQGVRSG